LADDNYVLGPITKTQMLVVNDYKFDVTYDSADSDNIMIEIPITMSRYYTTYNIFKNTRFSWDCYWLFRIISICSCFYLQYLSFDYI